MTSLREGELPRCLLYDHIQRSGPYILHQRDKHASTALHVDISYEKMENVTLFGPDFLSDLQQNELDQRTLEESNA